MGDGHGEAVWIAEAMLEGVLPGARSVAVAAAAVGEDGEAGGVGVAGLASGAPPVVEAVDGKEGCVIGVADDDGPGIGEQVIDAVGDGEAVGKGAEVVIMDWERARFPGGAGFLKLPTNSFFLVYVQFPDMWS